MSVKTNNWEMCVNRRPDPPDMADLFALALHDADVAMRRPLLGPQIERLRWAGFLTTVHTPELGAQIVATEAGRAASRPLLEAIAG